MRNRDIDALATLVWALVMAPLLLLTFQMFSGGPYDFVSRESLFRFIVLVVIFVGGGWVRDRVVRGIIDRRSSPLDRKD